MEFVQVGGYTAVADYAHTPDSLEAAYSALRAQQSAVRNPQSANGIPRLICILGSVGGTGDKRTGRDVWKRPEMGKIAAHYCDEIILTNEDPYSEDPDKVLDGIEAGIKQVPYPRPEVLRILDRREAIRKAVDMMEEGDIVIGTGKGSEEWMHLAKGKKIPWNEREELEKALKEKLVK
jgi:UDP-N-acetylmuramoyl-L-alanyl-D-glutamate--2,6-diaminopimelate ligase